MADENKGPDYGQYGKGASGYQHYKIATGSSLPGSLASGCAGWFALLFCLGLMFLGIVIYLIALNFIGDLLGL